MKGFNLYISIVAVFLLYGCNPVHRGYKFEERDIENLQKAVKNHATFDSIVHDFGTPSYINSPMNNTICYIEANGKRFAFDRFFKPTYKIACIEFNKKNISIKLTYKELKEPKKAKILDYKTSLKKPV